MSETTVHLPEVEFSAAPVVTVDAAALARIRQAAHASPKRRARLCLHAGVESSLHEMLIVLLRGTAVPIHRHPGKPECYHVVSGLITLIVCNDAGEELRRVPLGPSGSGRSFLCRIDPGLWHTVEVESDEVVLHESTIGPLQPGDTEYLETNPV